MLALAMLLPAAANAQNAYIPNAGDNTVSVIDTATNTVIATIPVGSNPFGVAVSPDGTKAYITNQRDGTVSVIATATNTVIRTIPVGLDPFGVAITPDNTKAYVANGGDGTVSVIATATDTVITTITIGSGPFGIAITPDGTKAYLTDMGTTISVIDTTSNTVVGKIGAPFETHGVAITPDSTKAYVANGAVNSVSVIDTATNNYITTIPIVGNFPEGVAITPDGAKVYVGQEGFHAISVIDTGTNTVITTITGGNFPYGVAVTPDGAKVYVANFNDSSVSVIATATNTIVATIPVGQGPFAFGKFIGGPAPHGSPPVAANIAKTTPANTLVTIDLTQGASGNPTSAALVGTPVGGTVSGFPSTTVTFTPTTGFTGAASFQFTLANVFGTSNTATATITVTPGAPPSISSVSPNPVTGSNSAQPFTINGANFVTGANITLRDLTAAQTFPNRAASSFSSTQIVINVNFTTAAHSWSVEVINPDGRSSGQFGFLVIAPPSLPPIAKDQVVPPITAGASVTIDLSKNATGGIPTGAKTSKPAHGTISAAFGTSVVYTANACYTGPDSFTFRLTNDFGPSNLAKVMITVNPAGAPAIEVHLIDPYLLDAYHTNPRKITEDSLFAAYNNPAVQAKGLVADGVSAAIAVVKTNDCTGDVTLAATNGTTLFAYDPAFLTQPPGTGGPILLNFSAADLLKNGGFGAALVQAPIGGPAPLFSDPIVLSAQQGALTATAQADLVPPPVILVHGIWGDRGTLGGDDGAGSTNGLAHYLKSIQPWGSRPELVTTVCYSKYLGFDKNTDPALADPVLENNPCEQTSKDALASRIYGLLAYLDSLKIVGSRVDLVAHSMGGLAARNYASQRWYDKSLRSRKQGQFHEIITLNTPELGSKLASSLIDHKDCKGQGDFTSVWGSACGSLIPIPLTVAQCFAKLGLPLAVDPAQPRDGAVHSLIPADDPRGKALKKLLSPKIPNADWRAISATKPGNGALGTLLDGLIKAVIPGNAPPCGPFDTPKTIDGILGTADNDAIVTLSSQLGGVNDHAPIFQTFSGLSHTGVPFYRLFCSDCVNDNVPESPAVWQLACNWLSPSSACPAPPGVAKISAAKAVPANQNAGLSASLTPVSTSKASPASNSAVPMPLVVTKHPHSVDRLTLRTPAGLVLGNPFDLAVSSGSGGLPEFHVVQSSQTGAQKEVPVTILRVEGQTVHLNVTPKLYGDTRFQVIAAYPDGGVATKEVAANVNLPPLAQDGFHADELPVAGIPLVVAGKPNDPSNPTLRLQPWNSITVFGTNMRAYIPDTSQVQFAIDPASGSSVIELDAKGIIHPLKIGTATVKAQYTDPTNPLVTLTGQVRVNVVDKQQ